MSVSQVGSINVTGFSSCRSSDSLPELEALSAPLRRVPERPDSPPLKSRATEIPISTRYAIQVDRNASRQQPSSMHIHLTKAFLGSRDGGQCCVYSLSCSVLICCCIGISILIAGAILLASNARCSDNLCIETYKIGAGLGIAGAVGILLGLCAFITRSKLEPYYQRASDPNERAAYAVLHDLYQA